MRNACKGNANVMGKKDISRCRSLDAACADPGGAARLLAMQPSGKGTADSRRSQRRRRPY